MTTPAAHGHTTTTAGSDHGAHRPGQLQVHAVPVWLLLAVFGALLVLTILTVAVTRFDFGALNIWVALGIAVIKAGLVALYFMHLRWDSPFNAIVLICSLVFVAMFIAAAITDSREYKVNYAPPANSLVASQPQQ